MLTIRFDRLADLGLRPGGAGARRRRRVRPPRLRVRRARGYRVVALDHAADEVSATRDTFAAMVEAGEITAGAFVGALRGDATRLPFPTARSTPSSRRRCSSTSRTTSAAIAELLRVLRPGGVLAATVPTWLPEKINWMLSDEYHAPAAVGGHVRIYSRTELKAKLRAAGLDIAGSHHAHALHSPYWWLQCAVGVERRRPPAGRPLPAVPRVGHHRTAALDAGSPSGCCRRCSARAWCCTRASLAAA